MAPQRTCVGCRRRRDDWEMVRLGLGADHQLGLGRTLPGRGAWVCPEMACLERAVRSGSVPRALRRPVGGEGDDLLEALTTLLEKALVLRR